VPASIRDYGMVFQAPVLFDWRSVEDNVKLRSS
jgi:ABC-type nitrate/sulfonate/bicarbonate transport system ATPase subunit